MSTWLFSTDGTIVPLILRLTPPAARILHELDGQPEGEGFEFHLLALGVALALIVGGAGLWSLDTMLTR